MQDTMMKKSKAVNAIWRRYFQLNRADPESSLDILCCIFMSHKEKITSTEKNENIPNNLFS